MSWYGGFRPYVPVARRRAKAEAFAAKLAKKEKRELYPVKLEGRQIAQSFWGQAWCDNLEGYSDFENRLPRGRSYVRNGSVVDLRIESGQIKAIVGGSDIYHVTINITTVPAALWECIKRDCSHSIESLIDLLQGRLDEGIMKRLTKQQEGLFPHPKEIKMKCTCPDYARLCKHVAAVLYGVGARLDSDPELLFKLRKVDHLELIGTAVAADNLDRTLTGNAGDALTGDLGEIFGIDIEGDADTKKPAGRKQLVSAPAPPQTVEEASPPAAGPPKTATKSPARKKAPTRPPAAKRIATVGVTEKVKERRRTKKTG